MNLVSLKKLAAKSVEKISTDKGCSRLLVTALGALGLYVACYGQMPSQPSFSDSTVIMAGEALSQKEIGSRLNRFPGEIITAPLFPGSSTSPFPGSVVMPPPVNGVIVHPPFPGGIVVPPINGVIIHPPFPGGIVVPPINGVIVHPPFPGGIVVPPINGVIIHPPFPGGVVVPPVNGLIIHPPFPGTVVVPPVNGVIIHPPFPGTVINPQAPPLDPPPPGDGQVSQERHSDHQDRDSAAVFGGNHFWHQAQHNIAPQFNNVPTVHQHVHFAPQPFAPVFNPSIGGHH